MTDKRQVTPLIGLVGVLGLGVVTVAVVLIITSDRSPPSWPTLAALAFLVAISSEIRVRFRIRAVSQGFAWTDAAVVIALTLVPVPWAILCTTVGMVLGRLAARVGPVKTVFGVGKDTLNASVGGLVLISQGVVAPVGPPLEHLGLLILVSLTVSVTDELIAIPVIARVTGTRFRDHIRTHWDIRVTSLLARFLVVVCTLLLFQANPMLLAAIPPLVLSLHLWYSSQLRTRSERAAWHRLATATDALNMVNLDTVLSTAIANATALFSADEAEVECRIGGRSGLVRGNADGTHDDCDGPSRYEHVVSAELKGHDGTGEIGQLRLRFRGPVRLNERERYTLQTFAAALCTSIRNASAYEELTRVAEEHAHAAAHDALTGLANRRHLLERGTAQLARRAEGVMALLLLDLNHFKEVNDTLGHASGDLVLIQVAERLSAAVPNDDLVARLGGDEFAVLFRGLPAPAVAAHRAESLLTTLNEPIELDGMRISVEASGGIAVAPSGGSMTELLRRADVAMYQAKRTGRRIATYAATRDTADLGRLALGGDLPRAVAEHEFTVNFQPIVDLSTGEVVAAEALARWTHPARGVIDPLRFLEAVERSGLLPAFTEAILDQSLMAAGTWRDAGFDLPVAVNVSPRSLLDARFPGSVAARLNTHGLPPDRLFLELTETLTLSQLEVVDQVLGQLRDAGVRLALDDFGTGYSSLSVLSRIPVHELKIDRGFVMAMETSTEAAAVIRSTVDLGRSLDLVVVAEGVESEPQRRALWEMGCAAGQGHLFARPMSAARLLSSLHQGSGGRPGTLAPPLHDQGAVIRLAPGRRPGVRRTERLPHLPA